MNSGEHVWSRSIGGAPNAIRNHPALKGLKLDFDNMGQPSVRPGPLVTRTLLFLAEAGNLSGDPGGPMFRAYDKRTGAVVAEIELPSKASGAPMTYMYESRQYIVIAVATREHPAELVALSLPRSDAAARQSPDRQASLPGSAGVPARNLRHSTASGESSGVSSGATPEDPRGGREDLRTGRAIYAQSCAACHGAAGEGVSGSTSPLVGLRDLELIRRVVTQGSVKMPPMRTLLTKQQIERVSRFVAVELNRK